MGGDTLYADGVAAYETLAPAFKRMIARVQPMHSAARPYGTKGFYAGEEGRKGMTILPSAEAEKTFAHPMVRTLVDGRKSLFVNPIYTVGDRGPGRGGERGPARPSLRPHDRGPLHLSPSLAAEHADHVGQPPGACTTPPAAMTAICG